MKIGDKSAGRGIVLLPIFLPFIFLPYLSASALATNEVLAAIAAIE